MERLGSEKKERNRLTKDSVELLLTNRPPIVGKLAATVDKQASMVNQFTIWIRDPRMLLSSDSRSALLSPTSIGDDRVVCN